MTYWTIENLSLVERLEKFSGVVFKAPWSLFSGGCVFSFALQRANYALHSQTILVIVSTAWGPLLWRSDAGPSNPFNSSGVRLSNFTVSTVNSLLFLDEQYRHLENLVKMATWIAELVAEAPRLNKKPFRSISKSCNNPNNFNWCYYKPFSEWRFIQLFMIVLPSFGQLLNSMRPRILYFCKEFRTCFEIISRSY